MAWIVYIVCFIILFLSSAYIQAKSEEDGINIILIIAFIPYLNVLFTLIVFFAVMIIFVGDMWDRLVKKFKGDV